MFPPDDDDELRWMSLWARLLNGTLELDEKRLVRRLKKGDERAFNELVITFQARIYNICYRMVGDAGDAEDLAQETFVRAFKSVRFFEQRARLSTWLYRIATNLCKNYIAYRQRRHRKIGIPAEEVPESAWRRTSQPTTGVPAPRPDHDYERIEAQSHIQRALASLSADARELLILRDIEGLSYSDIAEVTEMPLGTIKSKLWRARVALKAAYDKSSGEVR